MDDFPNEIITIILSNLPVESLMRCRSVCQTWHAIIDNPDFVKLHFDTSTTSESGNGASLIFIPNFLDEIYTAREDMKVPGNLKTTKIELSLEVRTSNLIEPPVNGLVFMYSSIYYHGPSDRNYHEIDSSMFICNPATRNVVELPSCNPLQCQRAKLVRGFGFDEVNQEFKVVQIVSSAFNWINGTASEVQVYTLGSNSWRNIGRTPDVSFFEGSVFVNGASHWLSQSKLESGPMIIVSFHLTSLEFSFIPTPEFGFLENPDVDFNPQKIQLVKFGDGLSIVDSTFEDHIDVWVMKDHTDMEESWTRFSVTKYYMDSLRFTVVQLISSLRNNSEIVLLYGSSRLVAYNIRHRSFRSLESDELPGYYRQYGISPNFYKVYAYDESLLSLRPTKVEQPS